MKPHMRRLIDLAEKNVQKCPWCRAKSPEEYLDELKGEVRELELAFRRKDYLNAEEELGDVIWDCLVLAHICEKEGRFSSSKAISRVLKKIGNRKPWLMEGKTVTKEEAERIWKEAKRREKRR